MKLPPCGWCDRLPSVWTVDGTKLRGFCPRHVSTVLDYLKLDIPRLGPEEATAWLVAAEVLGS